MKRIDAFIQMDNVPSVLIALRNKGFEGLTVTQSLGRGNEEHHPRIGGKHGQHVEFNAVDTITIMVDDSKVEDVITIITHAADTGSSGDGKIFISSVDDAFDIHTKQRGIKVVE